MNAKEAWLKRKIDYVKNSARQDASINVDAADRLSVDVTENNVAKLNNIDLDGVNSLHMPVPDDNGAPSLGKSDNDLCAVDAPSFRNSDNDLRAVDVSSAGFKHFCHHFESNLKRVRLQPQKSSDFVRKAAKEWASVSNEQKSVHII
jgi:hypothetical protein